MIKVHGLDGTESTVYCTRVSANTLIDVKVNAIFSSECEQDAEERELLLGLQRAALFAVIGFEREINGDKKICTTIMT